MRRKRSQIRAEQKKWRKQARAGRLEHNLCRCPGGDEVKEYESHEEASADDSPYLTCGTCGLERLRIQAVIQAPNSGYMPLTQTLERLR